MKLLSKRIPNMVHILISRIKLQLIKNIVIYSNKTGQAQTCNQSNIFIYQLVHISSYIYTYIRKCNSYKKIYNIIIINIKGKYKNNCCQLYSQCKEMFDNTFLRAQ